MTNPANTTGEAELLRLGDELDRLWECGKGDRRNSRKRPTPTSGRLETEAVRWSRDSGHLADRTARQGEGGHLETDARLNAPGRLVA